MTTISNLRRQHRDICEVMENTKEMINSLKLEEYSNEVARNISVLAGKLKIHLISEDDYLYPRLVQSGDDFVKKCAENYIHEMGDLSKTFMEFKDKYNTRSKILSDINRFIIESNFVFREVEERIYREETELYIVAKGFIK